MSVLTSRATPTPAQGVVKHPLTWYMPRFWHGMRLSTWLRELARNRVAVSPSRWPMSCSITGFATMNSVLAGLERVVYGRRIDAVSLDKPPLFILGHWRSGTTFLHELLIRDPAHTYATTYQCFAPHHFVLSERWVTPWAGFFVPARRPMDNIAAGWDRPMEDEFALQNLGVPTPYLSVMFPNRGPVYPEYLTLRDLTPAQRERWQRELVQFCKRLSLDDGRRIVLKSPGHTARLRTLLEMFPGAKFVHLSRNPDALYSSTVSLWRSLNESQGLQASADESWIGPFVIDSLKRMYKAYWEDREVLDDSRLVELRYEDLAADPKGEVQRLYERLDLGDFARMEPELNKHLGAVKNYRTNRHEKDDAGRELVRREWAEYFERFGYE